MSATSGNALLNLLGAGTATVGDWLWQIVGVDGTVTSDAAARTSIRTASTSNASAVNAGTGTGMQLTATGTFTVTGAGTMIPSIDLVTANAAVVSVGSYFKCYRVGGTSVVSVGQWD